MSWLRDPARVYPVTVDPGLEATALISSDCWVRSDQPSQGWCFSASDRLRVGRSSAPAKFRSLLRFNVSEIPNTATVSTTSVNLYLDSSKTASDLSASYVLHRAGKNFNNSATWSSSGAEGQWTSGGGDPSGSAMGALTMKGDNAGYKNFDLTPSLVEGWIADGSTNKGLVLKQASEDVNNVLQFHSSGAATNRPKLAVNYAVPAAPPTSPVVNLEPCITPCQPTFLTTGSSTPSLVASSSDPDSAALAFTFEVRQAGSSTVLANGSFTGASGSPIRWQVPSSVANGSYEFRVSASDGQSVVSTAWTRFLVTVITPDPNYIFDPATDVDDDSDDWVQPIPEPGDGGTTWGDDPDPYSQRAALACWGEYSEPILVGMSFEWGGYTQCNQVADIELYIGLLRHVKKKNSVLWQWKLVDYGRTNRIGYIANVWEENTCRSIKKTSYKMYSVPRVNGSPMTKMSKFSEVFTELCRIPLSQY